MHIIHNDLIDRFTVNALLYIKGWIKTVQPNVIHEERGKKIIQFVVKQIKEHGILLFL